jgi:beta-alanine--pyruvate transaminase
LFARARGLEARFAAIMMSLRNVPHIADIRPIGLMCGIDLTPTPGNPGAKGYALIEHTFHNADLYVRITGDTLIVAPSLIATESDLELIRDKIATSLAAL